MQDKNLLKTAKKISISDSLRRFKGAIGGKDSSQFYKFSLTRSKSFNLELSRLKANADVEVLNDRGKVLLASRRAQKNQEAIATVLETGLYYIKVGLGRKATGSTGYSLALSSSDIEIAKNLVKDTAIAIDGANIVWTGFDGADNEVFLYNADTQKTTQLTNNTTSDRAVGISGSNVVWNSIDSNNQAAEVFFYNGSTKTTTQLTNNTTADQAVGISGFNVTWLGFDGTDNEVFLYNGTIGQTTQLTDDTVNQVGVGLSGANLSWNVVDTSTGISQAFFYNGATGKTIEIIGTTIEGFPLSINLALAISGARVAFTSVASLNVATSTFNTDVFVYDGATGTTTRLTTTPTSEFPVDISGTNVLWNTYDIASKPVNVFFYNGTTGKPTQLTQTGSNRAVGLSGLNGLWNSSTSSAANAAEVFFYDGAKQKTTQITSSAVDVTAAGISGSGIVWTRLEGGIGKLFFTRFAR